MDLEKIKGIAIVARDEGTMLGRVEAALFDTQTLDLRAFLAQGDDHAFIVTLDRVIAIGADALMIPDSRAMENATQHNLVDLGAIRKLKVVDEVGTYLGTVRDVEIDPDSGKALSLTTQKGGLLGIGGETTTIPMNAVRALGSALVTVDIGSQPVLS